MENSTFHNFIMFLWVILFWYWIFKMFYDEYKRKELEQDAKKAQIETAKYLKILAENSQKQKENSQN